MKRNTIGCDPEFFLVTEDGKVISAVGKIPGNKYEQHPLESGAKLQVDNVAVEFASAVGKSGEELVEHIRTTMAEIRKYLPKGTRLSDKPAVVLADEELDSPEAMEFGCNPDYNAWTVEENIPPEATSTNMRSCGGHIHVGMVDGDGNDFLGTFEGKLETVRLMDCFHGVVSVVLDNSEEAIKRRELYGKAGCHRPTTYGVEYRVLSNFWLKSPALVMLMDSLTQDVLKIMRENNQQEVFAAVGGDAVQDVINTGNVSAAKKLISEVLIPRMSAESVELLDMVSENIQEYNLEKEWVI